MNANFTTTKNGFDYDFYIIENQNSTKLELIENIKEVLYFNDEPMHAEGEIKNYNDIEFLKGLNVPFDYVNGLINCYKFIIVKNKSY